MKSFLILVCCLALAPLTRAADWDNHKGKKQAQAQAQVQAKPVVAPKIKGKAHVGANAQQLHTQRQLARTQMQTQTTGLPAVQSNTQVKTKTSYTGATGGMDTQLSRKQMRRMQQNKQAFKVRHFDLQKSNKVEAVRFRSDNRIAGAHNWQGRHYNAFRNYRSEWHHRDWWRHHHSRIVFVFGGWYYWNDNYWYPAWGYEPNAYYAYDGPIYAYNDLPPDQVVANVQASLQAQGYYHGEVDGLLGPLTRAAVAEYQQDHGLYVTSAIDEPTLEALGMV